MTRKYGGMDSTIAYKFRIYPDPKRQSEIDERIALSQKLYNKILEKAKASYEKDKNSKINKQTFNRYMKDAIAENKDILKIYSQSRQDIFIRVQKAYQNFFRRAKAKKSGAKQKAGFPRFKSRDRYNSITYPQNNGSFSIEKERKTNMLRVSRIGRMRIELHRQMEGRIKTMTIKREGKEYYAIFTVELAINPPKVEDTNPVGIDMGLNNFVALSDGTTLKKPKFFKKKEKRIARWQKIVARRDKKSKRRQKAKEKLQKEWNDVTRQSDDFMHKLSDHLVKSRYTSFAVEALNIQNMEKNHRLAQSIQSASWNRFIQMLSYKAESAGMEVIEVNPQYTMQDCSSCGNRKSVDLGEKTYICNRCELHIDRDVNASINILKRGRAGLARTYAQGYNCLYDAKGIASSVEELRTYPAIAGEAHAL